MTECAACRDCPLEMRNAGDAFHDVQQAVVKRAPIAGEQFRFGGKNSLGNAYEYGPWSRLDKGADRVACLWQTLDSNCHNIRFVCRQSSKVARQRKSSVSRGVLRMVIAVQGRTRYCLAHIPLEAHSRAGSRVDKVATPTYPRTSDDSMASGGEHSFMAQPAQPAVPSPLAPQPSNGAS